MHSRTSNKDWGSAGFLMREIWSCLTTTPRLTVSWSVPGRKLRRCVGASPGMFLLRMESRLASLLAMSALIRSWTRSRGQRSRLTVTVRMTAPTPDTLSHWRTRSYLREPPPMSSSRLQAFTPWEQINCTDLTIQSQATTTWVNPDLDSLYSLILINDNLAVLVLSFCHIRQC